MIFLKKLTALIGILVVCIVFVVYKNINSSLNPNIVPVKNINLPIAGTWILDRYVFTGDSSISEDKAKSMLGEKAEFSDKGVYFDNLICKNPSFKVKILDSKDYFQNNFKIDPSSIGIDEKYIKVVTVSSEDNFFDEFIEINKNVMLKFTDGIIFFFVKDGTQINNSEFKNIDKNNSKLIIPKSQKETNSKSGLLLGLKCIDETGLGYNYRTLWISSSYGKIMPIVNIKDLVVPRKSGFWKVGVKKVWEKGVKKDIVWGETLGNNKTSRIKYRSISGISSEILFVGEEYISMDDKKVYNDDDGDQRFERGDFSVLPLDNFDGNKMDFSKAFGDDAGSRLKYSADLYLKKVNLSKNKIDENKLQTNWSVDRRSGRWMLRGRIPYGDFDVMYAAPTILTDYDDLYPSFDVIKKDIPDAVDAYTSPNRDFIVVLTETELKIYSLNNKKIGKLDKEFDLKNGETAVMSQWSLGSYVDEWNKLIKNMKKN
ncbi:hypothetical protein [Clostridium autoethanogenum]|uniref:hypothetical protein n=1 Tax=Clostridium autoethanogenum TaxID=84023 RepID=UPI001FAAFE14|nr:hypothetical protein [Clostridium autoethanogenum]